MQTFIATLFFSLIISASAIACEAHAAATADDTHTLSLEQPYAFATTPNARTGAVFLTINNPSNVADSLIEVRSDVAEIVEIHQNLIDPDDGTMMMRKVKKIDVEPNGQIVLEPTGYHVMLINLKEPLVKEETFPLTLIFESGTEIKQSVTIIAPGMKPEKTTHEQDHDENKDHEHPEIERLDFSDKVLKAE